jgi:large subunit ribosomal protein L7Ae
MAPKRVAKAPGAKAKAQTVTDPLYEKRPKTFGIGGALPPKRDVRRYVKWPRYVRVQRQRRILLQRLKAPPALHQFSKALDKNGAASVFTLLAKYRPEDRAAKKQRLRAAAEAKAAGKAPADAGKPVVVKSGLHHVTTLVENQKAQLVVIAHDVDPVELVVWLPALCRKMGVPYVIVKGKARLGKVVHAKTASCLCLTGVRNEDQREFAKVAEAAKARFNDAPRVGWSTGSLGTKSAVKLAARERIIALELEKRGYEWIESDAA